MDQAEIVVIGAGVVGLAIARSLAQAGHEVVILEAERHFGTGISSRNSEVIHAGIYYPAGSLKARFCVAGRDMLYDYCQTHGIEHRRCGKLIVASDDGQVAGLDDIAGQAAANGVTDLVRLSGREIRQKEPEIRAVAGLFSPSTGIVDSHGLMLSLLGEAEAKGAMIAYETRVTALDAAGERIEIAVNGETSPALSARLAINAAGLDAWSVAAMTGEPTPKRWLARGCYFTPSGAGRFNHLVYPLPEPGGLGIHLTLDLAGQPRFGPDVEWVESVDFAVDPARAAKFESAIRRYWPGLPEGGLAPAYSGIRPKLSGPGMKAADFLIQKGRRIINLFGIESPGLTSCLAIADHIRGIAS